MKTGWRTPDGVAVLLMGTLFLGMLGWSGLSESNIAQSGTRAPKLSGGELPPGLTMTGPSERSSTPIWEDPAVGAASDAWVFDVFTPPVIFYDEATGRFSVSAPEVPAPTEATALNEPFGLSLEQVVREPFRLQLVGYAGTESDPIGIFENVVTTEGIVAREGHRFDRLDLELRRLVVQREDMIVPDSMPLRQIVAVAEIWDRRSAAALRLSTATTAWTVQPKAEVVLTDSGERRTVQAGNQIETAAGVFHISGVFFAPDSVTVIKRLPNGTQETLRLTPNLSSSL